MRPKEPQHALIIAIKPAYVDLKTLTDDPKKFQGVKFNLEAMSDDCEALRIAGLHRIATLEHLYAGKLSELRKLDAKLAIKPNDVEAQKERLAIEEYIRNNAVWLVAFYDSQCSFFKQLFIFI